MWHVRVTWCPHQLASTATWTSPDRRLRLSGRDRRHGYHRWGLRSPSGPGGQESEPSGVSDLYACARLSGVEGE